MCERLKRCFKGKYNFDRWVAHDKILMQGTAVFKKIDDHQSQYIESGTYSLDGASQEFYQLRYFVFTKDSLVIKKKDGAVLHEFILDASDNLPLEIQHVHVCNKDKYKIKVTVFSEDKFQTYYEIKGPHKNEIIHTEFVKNRDL